MRKSEREAQAIFCAYIVEEVELEWYCQRVAVGNSLSVPYDLKSTHLLILVYLFPSLVPSKPEIYFRNHFVSNPLHLHIHAMSSDFVEDLCRYSETIQWGKLWMTPRIFEKIGTSVQHTISLPFFDLDEVPTETLELPSGSKKKVIFTKITNKIIFGSPSPQKRGSLARRFEDLQKQVQEWTFPISRNIIYRIHFRYSDEWQYCQQNSPPFSCLFCLKDFSNFLALSIHLATAHSPSLIFSIDLSDPNEPILEFWNLPKTSKKTKIFRFFFQRSFTLQKYLKKLVVEERRSKSTSAKSIVTEQEYYHPLSKELVKRGDSDIDEEVAIDWVFPSCWSHQTTLGFRPERKLISVWWNEFLIVSKHRNSVKRYLDQECKEFCSRYFRIIQGNDMVEHVVDFVKDLRKMELVLEEDTVYHCSKILS